jgi:hypothetical protein
MEIRVEMRTRAPVGQTPDENASSRVLGSGEDGQGLAERTDYGSAIPYPLEISRSNTITRSPLIRECNEIHA